MLKFTVRRVLYSILILFFVMFLVYCLEYNMPGSYLEMKAQQLASRPGAAKSATAKSRLFRIIFASSSLLNPKTILRKSIFILKIFDLI